VAAVGASGRGERNIDLLRGWFVAYNARDVDGLIAYCDPEIEFHSVFAAVRGGVYHGHDGLRGLFADFADTWGGEVRVEPEAYFDLGAHVLAYAVLHGRGRQSGLDVALQGAFVTRWHDGRMVYAKGYIHKDDALRDLGVSEDELEAIEP
jgi:ketosteroid isomerase-like protein